MSQVEAAALFGVRQRTFSHAVNLLGSTPTESLLLAVEQGHIAVSDAVKVVDEPNEVQEAAVAKVLQGAARTVNGAVNREGKQRGRG